MKIFCLGPAGTNGHEVAQMASRMIVGKYPAEVSIEFCDTNVEVLERANHERAYGVLPIENSSAGLVTEVVRGWLGKKEKPVVSVIAEINIPIEHALLVNPEISDVSDITEVVSHPQALSQCSTTLKSLGLCLTRPVASTALATQIISTNVLYQNYGALASVFAGSYYGLKVFRRHMEDFRGNVTRFHLVGPDPSPCTGKDRTAIVFQLKDEPCVLLRTLTPLKDWTINMSSIHSVPLGRPGVFAFYVEIDCHVDVDSGKSNHVFGTIFRNAEKYVVLGSFPQGNLV